MKTPPLHHHWRMGKFDVNCKRCWELNAGPELLKACKKVINILHGKEGGHSHSDKIGLRCTVCQCMATGALESAIAKAKENYNAP